MSPRDTLSPAQLAALSHVRKLSELKALQCRTSIINALQSRSSLATVALSNDQTLHATQTTTISSSTSSGNNHTNEQITVSTSADLSVDSIVNWIQEHARITVNFHPDRLCNGRTVVQALLEDGVYKTQFSTRISNGGLTAYPGGDRDKWEERMFGGAYQTEGVTNEERPRYGGLNIFNYLDGACPRFGSCHLRLKKHMLDRTTYSYGDSYLIPSEQGVIGAFEPVLAAMVENIAQKGITLGNSLSLVDFVNLITTNEAGKAKTGRSLDDYIEAQVHSEIILASDVEAVVVDPSFKGTKSGRIMQEMADKYHFPLEWNAGFALDSDKFPIDFRGPNMPVLAARLPDNTPHDTVLRVTPWLLGKAAKSAVNDPDKWQEYSPGDALQNIKYLWHVLVVFGENVVL